MVAVGDDVAVIEDAERADAALGLPGGSTDRTLCRVETLRGRAYANRVSTPVRALGGFVGMGCPAFSGLLILRAFKQRDGRLYTRADLAQIAPIDQTWQSMLLPPGGELSKFMTDSRVGQIENQTAAGDYHGGIQ